MPTTRCARAWTPSTSRAGRRVLAGGLGLLVAGLAVTGCADSSKGDAGTTPPTISDSAPSTSPSASVEPPVSSTSAASSPSAAASSSGPSTTVRSELLDAASVPGFTAQYTWKEGVTRGREPRRLLGPCDRFSLTSIGATSTAYRSYLPTDSGKADTAAELVATFPDRTTAARALSVLKSWRGSCQSRLQRYDEVSVGDLQEVPLAGGTGAWYLLAYGPVPSAPDLSYVDAEGMAQVDSTIALVSMRMVAPADSNSRGEEPMVAALRAAAGKLAVSPDSAGY